MPMTRFAVRDFAGDTVAIIHAHSYTHASRLAERAGLPVSEIEDSGPSAATVAHAEVKVRRYLLTLPDSPLNLDDDPTPLTERLQDLNRQGGVQGFAQDGSTIYHLLQLANAAAADELLCLAQQECAGASLQAAVMTWPADPQRHDALHVEGLHVRTGPWF